MATLNIDEAIKAGYTPEEVNQWLSEHPNTNFYENGKLQKTPPAWLSNKTVPFVGAGLAGLIGSILGPAGTVGGAAAGAGGGEVIRRSLIDLLGYKDPNVHTVNNPPANAVEGVKELGTTPLVSAMAAYPVAEALPYAVGALPFSRQVAGKFLQRNAAKGGEVPLEALQERFGTIAKPNPNLTKGLTPAYGRAALDKLVSKEIMSQGRSGTGKIPSMTFEDALANRTGAYANSGASFLNKLTGGATPEQKLSGRIGQQYSSILHDYIPQTQPLDKIIQGSKTMQRVGLGLGLGALLKFLLGKGTDVVKETIIPSE